jgi:hypothetical protein
LLWRLSAAVVGWAFATFATLALFAVMRDFGRFEPSYLLAFFFGASPGHSLQAAMFEVLDWVLVLGVIAVVDRGHRAHGQAHSRGGVKGSLPGG